MTEYFICVLIAVIIETADAVVARFMKSSDINAGHPLVFLGRVTLWSAVLYVYFRTVFYYLDLGIDIVLAP